MSNTATISYSWSVKGKQPIIEQKQRKRERKTIFGCVEPKSGVVIASAEDKGNTATFFKFLVKVARHYEGQKVIMVVDNVRYHHAKRLKPILEKYKHKMELIYLPPYSPDLNPIERIWWYMRKKITHNRYIETLDKRLEHFFEFISQFSNENKIGQDLSNLIVNI